MEYNPKSAERNVKRFVFFNFLYLNLFLNLVIFKSHETRGDSIASTHKTSALNCVIHDIILCRFYYQKGNFLCLLKLSISPQSGSSISICLYYYKLDFIIIS